MTEWFEIIAWIFGTIYICKWLQEKIGADLQARVGPARPGPAGIFYPAALVMHFIQRGRAEMGLVQAFSQAVRVWLLYELSKRIHLSEEISVRLGIFFAYILIEYVENVFFKSIIYRSAYQASLKLRWGFWVCSTFLVISAASSGSKSIEILVAIPLSSLLISTYADKLRTGLSRFLFMIYELLWTAFILESFFRLTSPSLFIISSAVFGVSVFFRRFYLRFDIWMGERFLWRFVAPVTFLGLVIHG